MYFVCCNSVTVRFVFLVLGKQLIGKTEFFCSSEVIGWEDCHWNDLQCVQQEYTRWLLIVCAYDGCGCHTFLCAVCDRMLFIFVACQKNVEELLQRKGGGLSQDGSTVCTGLFCSFCQFCNDILGSSSSSTNFIATQVLKQNETTVSRWTTE